LVVVAGLGYLYIWDLCITNGARGAFTLQYQSRITLCFPPNTASEHKGEQQKVKETPEKSKSEKKKVPNRRKLDHKRGVASAQRASMPHCNALVLKSYKTAKHKMRFSVFEFCASRFFIFASLH